MTDTITNTYSSPFRASNGARYLEGLFYEKARTENKSSCVYTLKDQDHLGFPSLYRLYMECEDLTEWEFAQAHLDGWEHWQMLCACKWFAPLVERWRKELELKIRARALRAVKEEALDGRNAYYANKLLLEAGWKDKEEKARGRPSKEEIKKEAEKQAEVDKRLQEDMERVSIN